MKKSINGKIYNTTNAQKIGYYDNGLPSNDFDTFDTSLYLTKNGAFFSVNFGYFSGDVFEQLSKKEALEWCERYMTDADEYIKFFEDILEKA